MLVSLSSFVFSQANGGVVPSLKVVDGAFLMTQRPVRCVAGVDNSRDALLINLALPTYLVFLARYGDRREPDIVCHVRQIKRGKSRSRQICTKLLSSRALLAKTLSS